MEETKRFTKEFFESMIIRAVRTAAQVALTYITLGTVASDINWLTMLSAALVGAVYSMLTSIVTGLPETKVDGVVEIGNLGENGVKVGDNVTFKVVPDSEGGDES